MFLERGIDVSYETIRRWVAKFGPSIARRMRCRQPLPGDIWHLDEVAVNVKGRKLWLWRAVDQNGVVLDEILQRKRDKKAAKRLLHRLMKRQKRTPKRLSPTNRGPMVQPSVRWCRALSIGRTKASTIGRRTATCHCENGKGRCRYIVRLKVCRGSYQSTLPSEIASAFRPVVAQP